MQIHKDLLELRKKEKQITSEILDKLQTMEDCKGYLGLGYSSLFDYLVRGLNYSESTAYQRQSCVRLVREVPEIKEKIDSGVLTLSTITSAYKHIKNQSIEQKRETLKVIENKSYREVKQLFTEPAKPIKVKQTRYQNKVHIRLELSLEQNEKLEKLKALKSHSCNLEVLFESLIEAELRKFDNTNFKKTNSKTRGRFQTSEKLCVKKRKLQMRVSRLRIHSLFASRSYCASKGWGRSAARKFASFVL